MFMVTFEIPVVATSIVAINDDLGGVDDRTWLLTSYLLGYVGSCYDHSVPYALRFLLTFCTGQAVIVVSSKLSDIFGRQPLFISCLLLFLIFTAACSAAQSITQLLVPLSLC
jgi:MFS family permease